MKNWKLRWFILKADTLYYFKAKPSQVSFAFEPFSNSQGEKPLGTVPLAGAYIRPDSKLKKPFCFELFAPRISKTFYIIATDKKEMDDWMNYIKEGATYCEISMPTNLSHPCHVDFDAQKGFSVCPSTIRILFLFFSHLDIRAYHLNGKP